MKLEKLFSKARKICTTGLVLTVLANTPNYSASIENKPTITQDYSFQKLKSTLKSVGRFEKSEKKSLRNYWKINTDNEKKTILNCYNNPQKVLKSFKESETKSFKGYFQDYDKKTMTDLEAKILQKDYESRFPWKFNIRKLSLSD